MPGWMSPAPGSTLTCHGVRRRLSLQQRLAPASACALLVEVLLDAGSPWLTSDA